MKLKFHMIQDESQKRLSFQKSAENISFCQKASGRSHDMKSSSVLCSQNVEERRRKENKKVKSSTKKRLPLPSSAKNQGGVDVSAPSLSSEVQV